MAKVHIICQFAIKFLAEGVLLCIYKKEGHGKNPTAVSNQHYSLS